MLRAGFIGPPNGAPPRDPASMELLFDLRRPRVDTRTAPAGPFTVQWEFADAEPWHVRVDNGSTAAARRARAPQVDLELRCRYEDLVDIVAGRLDPRRALAHRQAAPARLPARALGGAYALRVTEKRLRKLLAEAGVDLERPRAADVEATWAVWERSARDTVRAHWASAGWRFEVGLSSRGVGCTFAFEPSQGLRPVEDGEAELGKSLAGLRELPGFAAVRGLTPAALHVGPH